MEKTDNYLSTIIDVLEEGQGRDIQILLTSKQSGGLFSKIVVVTASSARHASALSERTLKSLKIAGYKNRIVEKTAECEWILIDTGDIIIHIMQSEARERYDLESLWRFEDSPTGSSAELAEQS